MSQGVAVSIKQFFSGVLKLVLLFHIIFLCFSH